MCFRIPGRIVEIDADQANLARVDVEGSKREVSLAMVLEDGPVVGDHVLIHMGVAIEIVTADRAAEIQEGLQLVGRSQERALSELEASWRARGEASDAAAAAAVLQAGGGTPDEADEGDSS